MLSALVHATLYNSRKVIACLTSLVVAGCIFMSEQQVLTIIGSRIDPLYIGENVYFQSGFACVVAIYETRDLSGDRHTALEQLNSYNSADSQFGDWIEGQSFQSWFMEVRGTIPRYVETRLQAAGIHARDCFDGNRTLRDQFFDVLSYPSVIFSYSFSGRVIVYEINSHQIFYFYGDAS